MGKFCNMPNEVTTNITIGAAIMESKKLVIVKDLGSQRWWLPGGQVAQNETEEQGLTRLISKQMPGTTLKVTDVPPIVFDRKTEGLYKVFLCYAESGVYPPSGEEINFLHLIDGSQLNRYNIYDLPRRAINQLIETRMLVN